MCEDAHLEAKDTCCSTTRSHGRHASCMTAILVLQATAESLQNQIGELRAELGTDLMGQLSAADKAELKRLIPRLEELKVSSVTTQLCIERGPG